MVLTFHVHPLVKGKHVPNFEWNREIAHERNFAPHFWKWSENHFSKWSKNSIIFRNDSNRFRFIDFYDHFQQKFFFAIILRNDRNFRSNSPKFQSKFTQISINIGKKRRIWKGKNIILQYFRGVSRCFRGLSLLRIDSDTI